MAFLDNSGDIILDAVLTDTGRARLARGDGSFKIVKFSLGDDEINYQSYDATSAARAGNGSRIPVAPLLSQKKNQRSRIVTLSLTALRMTYVSQTPRQEQ